MNRRLPLVAALLLAGALLPGGMAWWAGSLVTAPAPALLGPPPAELAAHSLSFPSRSGTRLAAWFAPGRPGAGAVLLLHGIRANRRSMLGRARFLHERGYAVLLVDLQAHGESAGERITFGAREAMDAEASVAMLAKLAPGEKRGAIGISLGAAALVLADVHPSLSALVLESLYPTIEQALENRLELRLGAWGKALSPLLLMQLEPRLGVTPTQLRPLTHLSLLHEPVLLAHGTEDRHTSREEAQALYAALPGPKTFFPVPGAAHEDLHAFSPPKYEQAVGEFLARWLQATPSLASGLRSGGIRR